MTLEPQKLSQELDHYDGRWVATRKGVVVAHAEDEPALRAHPAIRDGDLLYPIGEPPSGFYLVNV
jgi:hypothetical protein